MNWAGPLAGVDSGYTWGKTSFVRTGTNRICGGGGLSGTVACYGQTEIGTQASRSVDIDGAHITPHLGYQWQFGNIVLGGEFGVTFGGGDGRKDCSNSTLYPTLTATCDSEYKYTLDSRARLGYATGNWLVYASGGLINAKFDNSVTYRDTLFPGQEIREKGSAHANGLVAGLGVEYQAFGGIRLGFNYSHKFFEDVSLTMRDQFGYVSSTRVRLDPDVLGGSLRIPLQQQAPLIQDPGPPAVQAPATAQAQVAPAQPRPAPAARPAAAPPARIAPAATPLTTPAPVLAPPAAGTPVPGDPIDPNQVPAKSRPGK